MPIPETADPAVALTRMVLTVLEHSRADNAANIILAQVITPYPPRVLQGADGVGTYPWPASVDVQPVPLFTRVIDNPAGIAPGEVPVQPVSGGTLVAGPEKRVSGVPILFLGSDDMSLTSMPLPGSYGLLLLTGKHHATCMCTGVPDIPRLAPSTARLSDSLFLPGFVLGAQSLLLPPSSQPTPASASQLGPRSIESELVYLRRILGGYALGGTDVRLGSDQATAPAARVGDTVVFAADVIVALAAVCGALGVPVPASWSGNVTTGSAVVKIL